MGRDGGAAVVVLGLASAAAWGIGDFGGGLAARRSPVLGVTLWSQVVGGASLVGVAWLRGEAVPPAADLTRGAVAGLAGLVGLLGLYRALAIGQIGVAAPVTAVLSAGVPVIAAALRLGWPAPQPLAGIVLALAGIWLLAWTPPGQLRPAGLGLAVLAGLGFGSFMLLIADVQRGGVVWPLVAARIVSVAVLVGVAVVSGRSTWPERPALGLVVLAGAMDAGGNALFVLAAQAGRLDVAATLASLYPVTTVLLAVLVLRERFSRRQAAGLAVALGAVPLLAGGG
jgi:drug/metabolite transporter (DMT)-like permease